MAKAETAATAETVEGIIVEQPGQGTAMVGTKAGLPVMPDYMDGEVAVKLFEKRSELMRRVKAVAVKATNTQDWLDFGGKPFVWSPGSEKIRAELGLKIEIIGNDEQKKSDEKGAYVVYRYFLRVSHPALGSVEVMGAKSSRNQFFATKTDWSSGEKVKVEIPQCEISDENVQKAAYANALNRAVTEFCGLRNLTWAEVKTAMGDQDFDKKTSQVEFKSGKKAAEQKEAAATGKPAGGGNFENTPEEIAACKKEIKSMLMMLANQDKNEALEILKADVNKDSLEKMSIKQLFWYKKELKLRMPKDGAE